MNNIKNFSKTTIKSMNKRNFIYCFLLICIFLMSNVCVFDLEKPTAIDFEENNYDIPKSATNNYSIIVSPISLTNESAIFSFNLTSETETNPVMVKANLTNGNNTQEYPLLLTPNMQENLTFSSLSNNTVYSLKVFSDDIELLEKQINFKTFTELDSGFELFYIIDASEPLDHILELYILGHYKEFANIYFENGMCHSPIGAVNLIKDPILLNSSSCSLNYYEDNYTIQIETFKEEGYFTIKYLSNRSYYIRSDLQTCEGLFCNDYLMVSGEHFLFGPLQFNPNRTKGYLVIPSNWIRDVGWETEDQDIIKFHDFLATYCFAYNPNLFQTNTKIIYGDEFTTITSNDIDIKFSNDHGTLYSSLCEIWGGGLGQKYVYMFVNDIRKIGYIESSMGSGINVDYNYFKGLYVYQLIHGAYHRWNGWEENRGVPPELGVVWDHKSNESSGFWMEGFNEFYVDVLLFENGFDFHRKMRKRYHHYKMDFIEPDNDISVLTLRENLTGTGQIIALYYAKGAVLAYVLNKEIAKRTSGNYSLDDVLKYLFQKWRVEKQKGSYDAILAYLDSIIPGGMKDWWNDYVINCTEIFLLQFEIPRPTYFYTENQTITNNKINVQWNPIPDYYHTSYYNIYIDNLIYETSTTNEKEIIFENSGTYLITVRAVNSYGEGNVSDAIAIKVIYSTPSSPILTITTP